MESYRYEQVNAKLNDEVSKEDQKLSWRPFLRQLLVCSGLFTTYFVTGLSLGAPTVTIPQLRSEDLTSVSDEMASWLSSAFSYSAIPWVIILPTISQRFGRKPPIFFAITTSVISFTIFYYGNSAVHFLSSQVIQGILFSSNMTISVIMVTEYTSPKYRGIFLSIKSASVWWGMWASNAIGTFCKWNYIGLFGLICSSFYVTVFIWPESPHWLATRGRFEECIKSHRWLKASAFSYSAIPWVIILPTISQRFGRKPPIFFAITTSVISFTIFYFGNSAVHFLTSQVIQGILFSSNMTISVIMVTEYTSPKYRGIFLSIKSASVWWGMWASNAIGTFCKWNYIGLFGLICSSFYVTVFIWPESPHWLATRGRFEECIKAHRWLKGTDKDAEDELRKLIDSQKEYLKNNSKYKSIGEKIKEVRRIVTLKEFYMPISLSVLVMAQYHSSGKMVCSIYSIELIKKITKNESTAYIGMLILDGVSVLGMYVGSALSKCLTRRFLLLVSSTFGIIFLFSMSLYTWLVKQNIVSENKVISISILSLFAISLSCGPVIMSTSIYAELIPLRFKSAAVIITVLIHFILMGTSIKVAPLIFRVLDINGTFLLYGVLASILTFVLYKYLPETKDKTLLEIEEYFKNKTDSDCKVTKKLIN